MNNKKAKELLGKYVKGETTPEETAWVESWYLKLKDGTSSVTDDEIAIAMAAVRRQLPGNPVPTRSMWPRIAAAAAIVLAISGIGYFATQKHTTQIIANNTIKDVNPGSNKAILTLANGTRVDLAVSATGVIAQQGGVAVLKNIKGELVYKPAVGETATNVLSYNTITTPRGGQWPVIILPDGSKVILDAASSIKYPVVFAAKERRVVVTGQAYFIVKHNAEQPFIVNANGTDIKDVGTEFNVNAYNDEPELKTTLVEGKIEISTTRQSVDLKPGQAATIKTGQSDVQVKEADVEAEIAWKNGETSFSHQKLAHILRQVSRWYDVDIVYEGTPPDREFNGGIPRNSNLSSIMKVLELNNVHCVLNGKRLIIKP